MSEQKARDIYDYFREGQDAHRENKDKAANPYAGKPETLEEAATWDDGWDSEQKAAYGN